MIVELVMFDVDGTLTQSSDLDTKAFVQALKDVFGFNSVSTDWGSYTHVSDSGILQEICLTHRGNNPTLNETERFRTRLVQVLSYKASICGGIKPVRNASGILSCLLTSQEYAVAYAGGSWADSALFKLRSAKLPTEGITYAFADDDFSREGIYSVAQRRAEDHYHCRFSRVVYIGDGVWDICAARRLGYSFIGIGGDEGSKRLHAEGATHVFPDYQDMERFFLAVRSAGKA
jgi:phosphoglycolate phosphatase-like HAD superfamily hydrolase